MTHGRKRILAAVVELYDREGWPVTVRDVQHRLGYAGTATVYDTILWLEGYGLVETRPSRRGGWRPTAAGRTAAA